MARSEKTEYDIIKQKRSGGVNYALLSIGGDSYRVFSTRSIILGSDEIVALYGQAGYGTIELTRSGRRFTIQATFHGPTYWIESNARHKLNRLTDSTGLW